MTTSRPLPPAGRRRPPRRPRPNLRRLVPVGIVAAGALAGGLVAGGAHEPAERGLAARFAAAWERGDYAAMHALLTPAARRENPLPRFTRLYRSAATTATLVDLRAAAPRDASGDAIAVPVAADTRIFGRVAGDVALPLAPGDDGEPAVDWAPQLVFPGLRPGEALSRRTALPPRGALQARDGTPLAEGDPRSSELGPLAAEIAGTVGPAPPERAAELAERGLPPEAAVGLTGLEREFDARLAGTPGGQLLAGGRVIASSAARPGSDVRTTIDPELQGAAVEALAGRYGGVAVVRPADGEVLALAGIASSAPQPPGSVFKIVTLAGALEAGAVEPDARFPVQTAAVLEGVELQNASGEACGGTLLESFAHSCNSVFAPVGVELGAERLVIAAERFGFNEDPGVLGAARPTIPPASEIGDDLAVGSTAIGQGKVLTTPLHMALVTAAIAEDGRRVRPTLERGAGAGQEGTRATTPEVARFVDRAMRAVVRYGTGVGAAVDGAVVAGKTGTAELRSTVVEEPVPGELPPAEDPTDTDAWFTAYAPARDPEVAVCVLFVAQGAGGETAAPAARVVLEAALR